MPPTEQKPKARHKRIDTITVQIGTEQNITMKQLFDSIISQGSRLGKLMAVTKDGKPFRLNISIEGEEEVKDALTVINAMESRWLGEEVTTDEEIPGWLVENLKSTCKQIKHSGTEGYCYFHPLTDKVTWVASILDKEPKFTDVDVIESWFMKIQGVDDFKVMWDEHPDEDEEGLVQVWPVQ